VYQKSYVDRQGKKRKTDNWYIQYLVAKGKVKEEPTKATTRKEAVTILLQKLAEVPTLGEFSSTANPERVTMNQLFDLLVKDHKLQERKSFYDVEEKGAGSSTSVLGQDESPGHRYRRHQCLHRAAQEGEGGTRHDQQ
jgi:hypothetical protein